MNLSKSKDFWNPHGLDKVNIIGCGSVGSTVAETLARCGIENVILWDDDIVEEKNIVNQMFFQEDVGKRKTESLSRILREINPDIKIQECGNWNGEQVYGYVFMCVDNIDIRKRFLTENQYNMFIDSLVDIRTSLESAMSYGISWKSKEDKGKWEKSMNFTHEEAQAETPVSACGVTLGVCTTVRVISSLAVNNFINYTKGGEMRFFISADSFRFELDAF